MSKKEPSKLRKVVGSTVLAPVNLVFNRGTKSSGKVYSDAIKAQSKIYCPKCTQGVFQLLNNNTDKDDDDNSGGHTHKFGRVLIAILKYTPKPTHKKN